MSYQQQPVVIVQQPRKSVTRQRKKTSHTFHLIMTLCTFGLWSLPWALMTIIHKFGRRERIVTRYR